MSSAPAINASLVEHLVSAQFPDLSGLEIRPVANSGWDNRMFRLGDALLARLPSAEAYAPQVRKEQTWLPRLARHLPVTIPKPVAMGAPGAGYPFNWSVYEWIPGKTAAQQAVKDMANLAADLARFLRVLQRIDAQGAPRPDSGNFFRGGPLSTYDAQTRQAIGLLADVYDPHLLVKIWEAGLNAPWREAPAWTHGDVAAGNLLIRNDRLCAVIDFGLLAAGDPACDLAVAWTLLDEESRTVFRAALAPDEATWGRGRCWALWKALILRAGLSKSNAAETASAAHAIDAIVDDHARNAS